jgi:hypothetical protein
MFSFSQSENPNPNSFELFLFFIHLKMRFSLNFFTDKSFLVFKAWNQSQFLLEILEKFCYHISSAEYSLYFFLRISCAESEKVITANSTSIWSLTFAYKRCQRSQNGRYSIGVSAEGKGYSLTYNVSE